MARIKDKQKELEKEKLKAIARCDLFKTLPPQAMEMLAAGASEVSAQPGDLLIVEGKPAPGLFVVVEGKVDYIKLVEEKSGLVICRWGEGDVVGLDALFDPAPYFVSAVATTPGRYLRLAPEVVRGVCDADPQYEHRIYTQALFILSNRLRQITLCLRQFLSKAIK